MTESAAMQPTPAQLPIVARAGAYYRNMRYLMCVGLICMGGWFAYDGFINWPRQNQVIRDLTDQREQAIHAHNSAQSESLLQRLNHLHGGRPYGDFDLFFNRMLGIALPPLGILLVLWALYNSRGEYRLEGQTLTVPGHPPVSLSDIKDVDARLWDRKGIAYVSYARPDGGDGKIKLDDFVYQRKPTDEIYEQIAGTASKSSEAEEEED